LFGWLAGRVVGEFVVRVLVSASVESFVGRVVPPDVGIDDSPQAKAVAADAVADQQVDDQRPDAEDSDVDFDVGTEERDDDETCERVNCFHGRASSAYIGTNESPSTVFVFG
jgi:hypothetical protein